MNHWVLDASIASSWLLPNEASGVALAIQEELLQAEGIWVDAHWRLEVANLFHIGRPRVARDRWRE